MKNIAKHLLAILIAFCSIDCYAANGEQRTWEATSNSDDHTYPGTIYNSKNEYVGGGARVELTYKGAKVTATCIDPYADGCTGTGETYVESTLDSKDYAAYSAILNDKNASDAEKITAMKTYSVLNSDDNTVGTKNQSVADLYASAVHKDDDGNYDWTNNHADTDDFQMEDYRKLYEKALSASDEVEKRAAVAKKNKAKQASSIAKMRIMNYSSEHSNNKYYSLEQLTMYSSTLLALKDSNVSQNDEGTVVYQGKSYKIDVASYNRYKELSDAAKNTDPNKKLNCTESVSADGKIYTYHCDIEAICKDCAIKSCDGLTGAELEKCLENCKSEDYDMTLDDIIPGGLSGDECAEGYMLTTDDTGRKICVKDLDGDGTPDKEPEPKKTDPDAYDEPCTPKLFTSTGNVCQRMIACVDKEGNNRIGTKGLGEGEPGTKPDANSDFYEIFEDMIDDEEEHTHEGDEGWDQTYTFDCSDMDEITGDNYDCNPVAKEYIMNPKGTEYCDANGDTTIATITELEAALPETFREDEVFYCMLNGTTNDAGEPVAHFEKELLDLAGNSDDATDLVFGDDAKIDTYKLGTSTVESNGKIDVCKAACSEDYNIYLPGPTSHPGNNIGDDGIVSVNAGSFFNIDSSNARTESRVTCYYQSYYGNLVKGINSIRQTSADAYNYNKIYNDIGKQNTWIFDGNDRTATASYKEVETDKTSKTIYSGEAGHECYCQCCPEEGPCKKCNCQCCYVEQLETEKYPSKYQITKVSTTISNLKRVTDINSDASGYTADVSKNISTKLASCYVDSVFTQTGSITYCDDESHPTGYTTSPDLSQIWDNCGTEIINNLRNNDDAPYHDYNNTWLEGIEETLKDNLGKYYGTDTEPGPWRKCAQEPTGTFKNEFFNKINDSVFEVGKSPDTIERTPEGKYTKQTNYKFNYYDGDVNYISKEFMNRPTVNTDGSGGIYLDITEISAKAAGGNGSSDKMIEKTPRIELASESKAANGSAKDNKYPAKYRYNAETVTVKYDLNVGFCTGLDKSGNELLMFVNGCSDANDCLNKCNESSKEKGTYTLYTLGYPVSFKTTQGDYYYKYTYDGIGHYFDKKDTHSIGNTGRLDSVIIQYYDIFSNTIDLNAAKNDKCYYNVNNCESCRVGCYDSQVDPETGSFKQVNCNLESVVCSQNCRVKCQKGGCILDNGAGFLANYKIVSLNSFMAYNINQNPNDTIINSDNTTIAADKPYVPAGSAKSKCGDIYKCSSTDNYESVTKGSNWGSKAADDMSNKGEYSRYQVQNAGEGIYSNLENPDKLNYTVIIKQNTNIETDNKYQGTYEFVNGYYQFRSNFIDKAKAGSIPGVVIERNNAKFTKYPKWEWKQFTGPAWK